MLLAAGRGERMRSLGQETPKPLLRVGQHSLIEHHLYRLAKLGFHDIVINVAHLGTQIQSQLKSGDKYNLRIRYSDETKSGALETAGGIHNALPLLDSDPFMVINADIWTDFDFRDLLLPMDEIARLVMVPNPSQHPEGDFYLNDKGCLEAEHSNTSKRLTFSGIALYRKSLFDEMAPGKCALAPILHQQIALGRMSGLTHQGIWDDVGTPERLRDVNSAYAGRLNQI